MRFHRSSKFRPKAGVVIWRSTPFCGVVIRPKAGCWLRKNLAGGRNTDLESGVQSCEGRKTRRKSGSKFFCMRRAEINNMISQKGIQTGTAYRSDYWDHKFFCRLRRAESTTHFEKMNIKLELHTTATIRASNFVSSAG